MPVSSTKRWILSLAIAAAPLPALAHHSFAMFDATKRVSLKGVVKDYVWTNPHSEITLLVPAASGKDQEVWVLEMSSPSRLVRAGWSKSSLRSGDAVTVEINPIKDGGRGGSVRKVTVTATGQVLSADYDAERGPGGK